MSKYLIIADGDFLIKDNILLAAKNKIIIALDGAAEKLIARGINPHMILGDFDSINQAILDSPPDATKIIHKPDQNFTDLQKAIHFCDEQGAEQIDIICALGGKIDLHESNMRSLRSEHKKQRPMFLHTNLQTLCYIKDEELNFTGDPGNECGVLAYPKGIANSQGLKYELNHFELEFAFSESVCNYMLGNKASVSVQGEALIVMPLQLS